MPSVAGNIDINPDTIGNNTQSGVRMADVGVGGIGESPAAAIPPTGGFPASSYAFNVLNSSVPAGAENGGSTAQQLTANQMPTLAGLFMLCFKDQKWSSISAVLHISGEYFQENVAGIFEIVSYVSALVLQVQ